MLDAQTGWRLDVAADGGCGGGSGQGEGEGGFGAAARGGLQVGLEAGGFEIGGGECGGLCVLDAFSRAAEPGGVCGAGGGDDVGVVLEPVG